MEKTFSGPPPEHAWNTEGIDPSKAVRACKNCMYYGVLDVVNPICRFDPPKLMPLKPKPPDQPGWESCVAWPDIQPETDWCGKFVPVRNWVTPKAVKSEVLDL